MERIDRAAIKHNRIIFSLPAPKRHHHVIHHMSENYNLGPEAQINQGFVTSTGQYVDREEAWPIAAYAGQLLERAPTGSAGTLYSEDVW